MVKRLWKRWCAFSDALYFAQSPVALALLLWEIEYERYKRIEHDTINGLGC